MTPLWTTAIEPSVEVCGWALRSLAGPCVAQRVWLMPWQPGAGRSLRKLREVGDAAGAFAQVQVGSGERGDAGAVVAAIFEPAQAFDEDGFRFAMADVADDSAHGCLLRESGFPLGRIPAWGRCIPKAPPCCQPHFPRRQAGQSPPLRVSGRRRGAANPQAGTMTR